MKKKKSMLKLSLTAVAILHFINKAIDSSSTANMVSRSNGKYYHWTHGDIFYRVSGKGDPVLLVHDLNVFSSNNEWAQVAVILSEHHTVYALDLIGCGKSDKPGITYTNFFYVQLITDFIRNVIKSETPVVVTGTSASFVIMAEAMRNDLFQSITMINPPTFSQLEEMPDSRSKVLYHLFDLPVVGKTAYYIATNKPNTDHVLSDKWLYNPFNLKPSTAKAYYDSAHAGNGDGKYLLASLAGNYLNTDIKPALQKCGKKIDILLGDHYIYKDEIKATYSKMNGKISCSVIKEANYLPQIEVPEEMGRILEKLLENTEKKES